MKQTLIVSSCDRGVTVKFSSDLSRRSVRIEKTDTSAPLSVWNFFPIPPYLSCERRQLWIKNNQILMSGLLMEMRKLGLSRTLVFQVIESLYDEGPIEWVAEGTL